MPESDAKSLGQVIDSQLDSKDANNNRGKNQMIYSERNIYFFIFLKTSKNYLRDNFKERKKIIIITIIDSIN